MDFPLSLHANRRTKSKSLTPTPMNSAIILWGTRTSAPDGHEEIITTNEEHIEQAKMWALANGFNRLRVAYIDLDTPPSFHKTLTI